MIMKAKSILLIFSLFFTCGCNVDVNNDLESYKQNMNIIGYEIFIDSKYFVSDKTKIILLLRTKSYNCMMYANYIIGDNKDTTFVPLLLRDSYNSGRGSALQNKGISIYESKMAALREISGLKPPKPITHEPDSVVVNFYREWAIKKGYKLK